MASVTGVSVADELPGPDGRGPLSGDNAGTGRLGDRLFAAAAKGSGALVIGLVTLVGVFLLWQAIPAIADDKVNFLTSREWSVSDSDNLRFGIVELLWTTVAASTIAMLIAVPGRGGGRAVHHAVRAAVALAPGGQPHRPARGGAVDRLRPLGPEDLQPVVRPVPGLAVRPPRAGSRSSRAPGTSGTILLIGVVLSIMILPIVTALSREVFAQTPVTHKEGALALGATKWEMIRTAVLPFGRPGVISAAMLALGRALGETIAVTIIVSTLAAGLDVDLVAAQRRRDLRLEDRQQRRRVRLARQDRRLHRRRPGAVRPDLRRQRDRPHRHRAQEGLHRMSTDTVRPRPGSAAAAAAAPCRRWDTLPGARRSGTSWPASSCGWPSCIALIPLVWILWTVLSKGVGLLLDSQWWTNPQNGITSRREGGGAVHAIQGTLIQGVTTSVISVPIGVMTAIYLVEYGRGKLAKAVTFMVDILTGVPSIVAGLFIYAVWVTTFGFQRVGFAVSLALVLLMIPVVVRSTEEMLKLVPNELREASYALGVPKWKTIVRVVLPDRLLRHHHRRPARPGPRHGRDRAAADPRARTRSRSPPTCSAATWPPCPR